MVAGAARITSNTRAMLVTIKVRPQRVPAPCPGTFGCSLGPVDGAVPGDTSSAVDSEDGSADGSLPEESAFCTVHDGADPVTLAGVGSNRTQP